MTFHVKDGTAWKTMASGFVNDGGIWKPIKELWINDASVWKRAYQNVIEIVQTGHEAHVYLRSKVIAGREDGRNHRRAVEAATAEMIPSAPFCIHRSRSRLPAYPSAAGVLRDAGGFLRLAFIRS